MRLVPRAELIPMKGLRPEGQAKEEAQAEPGQKQDAAGEENAFEDQLQQEPGDKGKQEVSCRYRYACPSGCGANTEYQEKPCKQPTGDWPKARCYGCGKVKRIGGSVRCWCTRKLTACGCELEKEKGPE